MITKPYYTMREDHTPDHDVLFPYTFLLRAVGPANRDMITWEFQMKAIIRWCADQFGPESREISDGGMWLNQSGCFRFKRPEDATAFKVRWG